VSRERFEYEESITAVIPDAAKPRSGIQFFDTIKELDSGFRAARGPGMTTIFFLALLALLLCFLLPVPLF